MIIIDGSAGEGGGQVLRTALGLSLVTGRPFQITNIRGNRQKPGLMRQHLTAVRAAAEVGKAQVDGAEIRSSRLSFAPGSITPGAYRFSIGTAGSCTLVFQAILPALLIADGPSEVILEGGTHNPMAPPFDFLDNTFLPLLNQMGAEVVAVLERPGFYPAGGGRLRIKIRPAKKLQPLELTDISNIRVSARAISAELPSHIGRRELSVVQEKMNIDADRTEQVQLDTCGPGNTLSIFVHSDQLTETFTGFAEKRISAEKVALRAVKQAKKYITSGAPVGMYLADQLLIPLAMAGAGRYRTCMPTRHTLTNIEVIQQFLDVNFHWSEKPGDTLELHVES